MKIDVILDVVQLILTEKITDVRGVTGSNLRIVRFEDEHAVWCHLVNRLSLLCLLLL